MQLDLFATETEEKIHETFIKDLKRGSGFENGKKRIIGFFEQNLSKAETIKLLKDEYGVGGRSTLASPDGYAQSHDSKGIKIYLDRFDEDQQKTYTWSEVYDALFNLIETGEYFEEQKAEIAPGHTLK